MSDFDDVFGSEEENGVSEKKEKPVTYVGFVWDDSGSMGDSVELARKNFNEQLVTLKKDSDKIDYRVTIVEFDNELKWVAENEPIEMIEEMVDYWTGGMTALYDAVGMCINRIKSEMDRDESEDKAALVVVMTDGEENNSTEFDNITIRNLITKMDEEDNWSFVFMGAGIDERQAMSMGFGAANTMTFDKSYSGYAASTVNQNSSLSTYSSNRARGITKTTAFYNDAEEEDKKDG